MLQFINIIGVINDPLFLDNAHIVKQVKIIKVILLCPTKCSK